METGHPQGDAPIGADFRSCGQCSRAGASPAPTIHGRGKPLRVEVPWNDERA